MKFVDFFCGMGTIRMGFEQAGHECVYSVEFDKHKREIYKVIFGSEPDAGDIRTVRASDIPRSDCWCFGAPCQDFSIAGLRAGLDGERSGLVREVFRLVREKEPADLRVKQVGNVMQTITEPCACLTPDRIKKRQNGRRFKEPGEPMFTLTKQDIHGIAQNARIRRLTPRECMRLQGVPDYITDKLIAAGISDTQMYRAAGDACTVNVIYEIARRL